MAELPSPFEIFELEDGQTYEMKFIKFEEGEALIHPAYKPQGKWIKVLRVWVTKDVKEFFPYYWDITSSTLVAQLLPMFAVSGANERSYLITKHGVAPKARFSVEVV